MHSSCVEEDGCDLWVCEDHCCGWVGLRRGKCSVCLWWCMCGVDCGSVSSWFGVVHLRYSELSVDVARR